MAANFVLEDKANDPSPAGWRVPTFGDINKLFDAGKVTNQWTTQNGVNGCKFTDKATNASIFFPAAGHLRSNNGTSYDVGERGGYWSSTREFDDKSYSLDFRRDDIAWDDNECNRGFCVRPVAE